MTVFTASDATLTYLVEQSFRGNVTDDSPKPFGRGTTVETYEFENNGEPLYRFGSRLPDTVSETQFRGSFSVSFTLATFTPFELFEASPPTDGSGNDVYDFGNLNGDPQSFKIKITRDSGIARLVEGCVAQSLEIDSQVDGTVSVTISGAYATETRLEGVSSPSDPSIAGGKDALTFADTTLNYKSTNNNIDLALPRGVTISIEQNNTLLSVLGQRTAGDFSTAEMTVSLDITHALEQTETVSLEDMYGSAGSGSPQTNVRNQIIKVTLDNGNESGTGSQAKAVFEITGFPDSYSEGGLDVQEDFVNADLSFTGTDIIATVSED